MDSEFIENVYASLQGLLVEDARIPGVENLFTPGSPCECWYQDMLDAYARLCHRLGSADEDKDVEIIITALLAIGKELSFRMYEYGAKFGMPDD